MPTTAGTGSEVTITAVITDPAAKHKYTMNDFALIPAYAVLDPEVTFTLPPHLTASTGMDALTHVVEAYIGRSTTQETLEGIRTEDIPRMARFAAKEANPLYPVPVLWNARELERFYHEVSSERLVTAS